VGIILVSRSFLLYLSTQTNTLWIPQVYPYDTRCISFFFIAFIASTACVLLFAVFIYRSLYSISSGPDNTGRMDSITGRLAHVLHAVSHTRGQAVCFITIVVRDGLGCRVLSGCRDIGGAVPRYLW
jgi:membrane protein implicated in regulation of membrane protease activity